MATVLPPRLGTNIDGTLASATSLVKAVRSLQETEANTLTIPGWRVMHPGPEELREVREVQVLEAQPGDLSYPYYLPQDANTTVMVETGEVAVYDEHDVCLGTLEHGSLPYFVKRGITCAVRALSHPTSVLVVSYRERSSGENT